jgi:hypothetical protein
VALLRPEDFLKSRDQRPRRVPLMRTCSQCSLSLPSTKFWSFMIERYSTEKLVRDSWCIHCRKVAGITMQMFKDKLMSFLERGGGNGDSTEIVIL